MQADLSVAVAYTGTVGTEDADDWEDTPSASFWAALFFNLSFIEALFFKVTLAFV